MDKFTLTRLVIGIVAVIIVISYFAIKTIFKNKVVSTKFIARTAIFSAFAIILYVVPGLQFKLPFFPGFLEVHLDEIPLLIASFAYGPWCGVASLFIKTLVKLPMTSTMCVGELCDFICSLAFILPSALIYKKHRKFIGAVIALLVGMVSQIFVSGFVVTYIILNFYMKVMNLPEFVIIGMINAVGIKIKSLSWSYMFYVSYPFNAFKDSIVVVATILIYKRLHVLIEKVFNRSNG